MFYNKVKCEVRKMTETEIKQYIISNPICTAKELMSECALTFDKLASVAQNDIAGYKALAENCGVTKFQRQIGRAHV